MNTKDIWQSLTCNAYTEPYFDGVFSSDMLKNVTKKPELIICNTDPSSKPGKHWILFFFDGDTVDYFDSLGNNLTKYGDNFTAFIKLFAKNINFTRVKTQPKNSDICGQYCLYFALLRCKGRTMTQIMKNLQSKKSVEILKIVNQQFKYCSRNKNILMQNCTLCE